MAVWSVAIAACNQTSYSRPSGKSDRGTPLIKDPMTHKNLSPGFFTTAAAQLLSFLPKNARVETRLTVNPDDQDEGVYETPFCGLLDRFQAFGDCFSLTDYPTKPCLISYFHSSRPGVVNNLQPWALKSDVTALCGDYISEDTHVCVFWVAGKDVFIISASAASLPSWKVGGETFVQVIWIIPQTNFVWRFDCSSTPSWKYLLSFWPIAITGSWNLTSFVKERKKDSS